MKYTPRVRSDTAPISHAASAAGPATASVMIYLLMAVVLFLRPGGLFPARG